MIASPLFRASVSLVVLLGARVANADCVISGVRPTVPLPTMELGQEFSFLATADCERVRFRVPGTTFVEIPKAGPDTGSRLRTYKVVLTEREWSSLVDESDTTFTWSIIGTTSTGVTTRVTTTNELKGHVTFNLSLADAKLIGEADSDDAGLSVAGAGDADGDGHDDLLVGAPYNDEGGSYAGVAYLVLGPVTGAFSLSKAHGRFLGEAVSEYAGWSVASAGDVDGDGRDDVLVSGHVNDEGGTSAGAAYLVLGPASGTFDLSLADAKLVGEEAGDYAGHSASTAGDLNDDGLDDVLVGAPLNDGAGPESGAAYVVLGPVTATLDLSLAGAKLVGEAHDHAGETVAAAGDVDGDGSDDLLIGAPLNSEGGTRAGAAYVVLGPVTGSFDLADADAKLVGEQPADLACGVVAGAGDVDGDGHDDLLCGGRYNDEGGTNAGAAYLVLGPVTGPLDVAVDAKLVGEDVRDYAGAGVAGAGDVDADGHDDVLVSGNGAAYLLLGPVTGTLDLSVADVKLVGNAGSAVAGAGDVDGDGRDDMIIGAPGDDDGAYSAGAAYVVFGGGL